MVCLFALFAGAFPRLATLFIWLARPARFSAAFNGSWLLPLLGVIFLPFTTLMYIIIWTPGVGIVGWDWFWLILAVVIDVGHWSHTAYTNRQAIPGYSSTPNTPSTPSTPKTAV